MGNTRRTLSTSHKLSLITLCATLSRSALAASPPARDAPRPQGSTEPVPFTEAGRWVLTLEGLAALEYAPGSENEVPGLDAEGRPARAKVRTSRLFFSTLAPRVGIHAFVVDHVSIGITAQYDQATFTAETTTEGGGSTSVSNVSRMLRLGPGAGLAYQSSSGFGIWARGALDVQSRWATSDNALVPGDGTYVTRILGASIQALATFAPTDDIVLSAGPSLHKNLASGGDVSGWSRPEDEPAVLALSFGAGLVL
jgi:hypothetical protein